MTHLMWRIAVSLSLCFGVGLGREELRFFPLILRCVPSACVLTLGNLDGEGVASEPPGSGVG